MLATIPLASTRRIGRHVKVPYQFFFAPYYTIGVTCFFVHAGYWVHKKIRRMPVWPWAGAGVTSGLLIVLSFGGAFYRIDLPHEHDFLTDIGEARAH